MTIKLITTTTRTAAAAAGSAAAVTTASATAFTMGMSAFCVGTIHRKALAVLRVVHEIIGSPAAPDLLLINLTIRFAREREPEQLQARSGGRGLVLRLER